jgi:hypothetical protein
VVLEQRQALEIHSLHQVVPEARAATVLQAATQVEVLVDHLMAMVEQVEIQTLTQLVVAVVGGV